MSVLGTTKHSSCNQCIDTWQQSYIVFLVPALTKRKRLYSFSYTLVAHNFYNLLFVTEAHNVMACFIVQFLLLNSCCFKGNFELSSDSVKSGR